MFRAFRLSGQSFFLPPGNTERTGAEFYGSDAEDSHRS